MKLESWDSGTAAAGREAATSGTGRFGGRAFYAELSGAVESVVEGYGIEKSSVSREFVAASNQLRLLCERRLVDLSLVY